MSPEALQSALFDALVSDTALDGLLARAVSNSGGELSRAAVYDHVPQSVNADKHFPYVVIGDDTSADFDTDTSVGSEATVTIHAWSRYRGRSEVKKIQRALYDALHRNDLTVEGRHTVDCIWEYAETVLDQDGVTRHGITRFRITTEEV